MQRAQGRQHLGPLAVLGQQQAARAECGDALQAGREVGGGDERLLAQARHAGGERGVEAGEVAGDGRGDDEGVDGARERHGIGGGGDRVAEQRREFVGRADTAGGVAPGHGRDRGPRRLEGARQEGTESLPRPTRPNDAHAQRRSGRQVGGRRDGHLARRA